MTYTPPSVVDLVQETLDRCLEALPADVNRRIYVAHGEPAAPMDACSQVTAHLVRMRLKLLRDSQQVSVQARSIAWVAQMAVVLYDCVPVLTEEGGDPPSAELDIAHKALLDAGTTMARHLGRLWAKGQYPASVPDCGDVSFGGLDPQTPQGGHAAYRLAIDVQL